MTHKKIFSNYFLITILISSSIYFLWSIKLLNDFPWRYVFTDWIINYEGGYIRRGLLGQLSINLSNIFNLNIKYIFFIVHLSIYLSFHLIFYKFFSNFKKNYIFYLLCFSPLVFLYPIATFEAFARKEIFYITFFLLNCYLSIKIYNRNVIFFSTNLLVFLSYFIHESSLFFINFFYLSYFIFLKKNNYKIKISELILILIIYIFLIYLLTIPVSNTKISEMVLYINQNFFEITEFSGAISWLNRSGISAFSFLKHNDISTKDFIRNFLLAHFLIVFFYLLIKNNFFKSNKYFLILTILSFISPLILFLVGNDWGRFFYIWYNFCLIFTVFCLYSDKEIFIKVNEISIIKDLNPKIKIFFTICYVSLWCPKIFFYDNLEIFPLFILFLNLIKYFFEYTTLLL